MPNSYVSSAAGRGSFSGAPKPTAISPAVAADRSNQPGTSLAELGWGPLFEVAFRSQLVDGAVPGRVAGSTAALSRFSPKPVSYGRLSPRRLLTTPIR